MSRMQEKQLYTEVKPSIDEDYFDLVKKPNPNMRIDMSKIKSLDRVNRQMMNTSSYINWLAAGIRHVIPPCNQSEDLTLDTSMEMTSQKTGFIHSSLDHILKMQEDLLSTQHPSYRDNRRLLDPSDGVLDPDVNSPTGILFEPLHRETDRINLGTRAPKLIFPLHRKDLAEEEAVPVGAPSGDDFTINLQTHPDPTDFACPTDNDLALRKTKDKSIPNPVELANLTNIDSRLPKFKSHPIPGPVGGRLTQYADNWETITDDSWLIEVIRRGYKLHFLKRPKLVIHPTGPRFQLSGPKLIAAEVAIQELLTKGAISTLEESDTTLGFYSPVFLVPKKNSSEMRLIIDLKTLNKNYLEKPPTFQMESIKKLKNSLRQADWMISIDLQDAYLHVPIHPSHRRYLRFAVNGQRYQFRVLPFGISIAPWLFTRITNPVIGFAHMKLIRLHGYIDDFLSVDQDKSQLSLNTVCLIQLLTHLGFLVHSQKSELVPTQTITYIGARFILDKGIVAPPEDRYARVQHMITSALDQPVKSRRWWMSCLGTLTSIQDLTYRGRLQLRSLQIWMNTTKNLELEALIQPPEVRISELLWWLDRQNVMPGIPLNYPTPLHQLYTDASGEGWGAHMDDATIQGKWSSQEKELHINCLEMRAIYLALTAWLDRLHHSSVKIATDHSTVVAYIQHQGGTRSQPLLKEVTRLYALVDSVSCKIEVRHIPGKLNILADYLSRKNKIVPTEWSLHPEVFKWITQVWDSPNIDLFATCLNNKLPVYVSPVPDPLALQVDALSMEWKGMFAYAFPPWALLDRVLRKIEETDCVIILIAPAWPKRAWFPRLLQLLIEVPLKLPVRPDLLRQPKTDIFYGRLDNLHLHAWKLSRIRCKQPVTLNQLHEEWLAHGDQPHLHYTITDGTSSSNGEEENSYMEI
ncbi:uncharacterized protein LOC125378710 [Haliotis rufescens]|uniref:uncharacterized protein LOC125378710 n=1 Tax=Haliotis rufescens TaxID=6454 RepID=UPI00201EC29E|nr:uncharacterized protein LOC125378710 [Haliotis rufescens]